MGLIGSLKGLPVLLLVALILLLVANLFNLIAFSTTAWGETYSYILNTLVLDPNQNYVNYGLWRVCSGTQTGYIFGNPGSCSDVLLGTALAWLAAVQAFACIALIGLILSLVLVLAHVLGKKEGDYLMIAAILCIVTGVLYLIGIIIYGVKFPRSLVSLGAGNPDVRTLGWSFGLACVACIMEIVSGVLLIVSRKGGSTSPA